MGYKSKAIHSNCYKVVIGNKEYDKRFSDIRDARTCIGKDEKQKGKQVRIYYLPAYDVPLLVDNYICL